MSEVIALGEAMCEVMEVLDSHGYESVCKYLFFSLFIGNTKTLKDEALKYCVEEGWMIEYDGNVMMAT